MTHLNMLTDGRVFYLEFILKRVQLARMIELDLNNSQPLLRGRGIT